MSHSPALSGLPRRKFNMPTTQETLPLIDGEIRPRATQDAQSIRAKGTDCKVSSVVLGLLMTVALAGGGTLIFFSGGPSNLVLFAPGVALGAAGLGFGIWIATIIIRTRSHVNNLRTEFHNHLNHLISYHRLLAAMKESDATADQVKAAINVLDQQEFNRFVDVVDQDYRSLLERDQSLSVREETVRRRGEVRLTQEQRTERSTVRRERQSLNREQGQLEKVLKALVLFTDKLEELPDPERLSGLLQHLMELTIILDYSILSVEDISLEDVSARVNTMSDDHLEAFVEHLANRVATREAVEVKVLKAIASRLENSDIEISPALAREMLMALDPDQDAMQAVLQKLFQRVGTPTVTSRVAYAHHPKFLASIMSGEERLGDADVRSIYASMDETQKVEYFRALSAMDLNEVSQVIKNFFVVVFESRQSQPDLLRAMSKLPAYLAKMHFAHFDSPAAAPMIQAAWEAVEARGDDAKQVYVDYLLGKMQSSNTDLSSIYQRMGANFGNHAIPEASLMVVAKLPEAFAGVFQGHRLSEEPSLVSQVLEIMNPDELTQFIKHEARLKPEKALLRARTLFWAVDSSFSSFDLSPLISRLVEDSNLESVLQRYDMSQDEEYAKFIIALLERVIADGRDGLPQLDQRGKTNYVALLKILVREAGENIDSGQMANGEFSTERLPTSRYQLMNAFRTDRQFGRLRSSDYEGVDETHKEKFLTCTNAAAARAAQRS